MNGIEARARQAGEAIRDQARRAEGGLGTVEDLARRARRGSIRSRVAVVLVLAVAGTALAVPLLRLDVPIIGPGPEEFPTALAWSGIQVVLPEGWGLAGETLTPNLAGPLEVFTASTAPMPLGNQRCAQVPEAAIEQLGPSDALVTVQRGLPAESGNRAIGSMSAWPAEFRDISVAPLCVSNGDELTTYQFGAALAGEDYLILAVFGMDASAARYDEALAVVNSISTPMATVPDVVGLSLEEARRRLAAAGFVGVPFDADEFGAIVSAQEPGQGESAPLGATVGLRTAVITGELCVLLARVPARAGDASDLSEQDGFWDMLAEAEPVAPPSLGAAIRVLLDGRANGRAVQFDTTELDAVAVAYDACHVWR